MPTRHHVEIALDEMEGMKELGYPCNKFFYAAKEGVDSKTGRMRVIFQNAFNLIKLARLFKPDVIYFNSRLEALAGIRDFITISLLKTLYRHPVRFVIKSHGSDIEVFESKNPLMSKIVLPFLKKQVSAWFFLSTEEQNTIINAGYLSADKVFVTKNIVRNTQFTPEANFKSLLKIPDDHKILLFVGRIIKQKGVYEVINAFQKIKEMHRTTLIIVGDGPELESIKQLTITLSLSKFVVFTGFIPEQDVIPFYASSDVLVFPTYFPEGFPMALFNAVAAGMCVVTTPTRAAVDYLVEPENCLWVEPENSIQLANKVNNLLQSQTMMDEMTGNNKIKGNLFSKQQVCAELAVTLQR
ncbi:glycosyltransferase family 4 protein [Mucilaginibacter jinjuensis]|uniref:Glycosyltransferase family 4 protein n=1 Tax=Mucilaginibacter jinjuensis TaxID=1176721 RepID=A0ABY7T2U6_9SPHI|nr:glycosyltransferase family 4 protein [Mucilaginibacter jinjuensis]WCT10727.1 glycosyltransferase family 4 protein [Mucilaginibacter jinjuensis]